MVLERRGLAVSPATRARHRVHGPHHADRLDRAWTAGVADELFTRP
ncbi:hypothetical protein OG372_13640 [Streptomyces sp. NBC_01020]|nr:hypothetical protein OG372_13640 [Streptomyces sp. NBC_01020]